MSGLSVFEALKEKKAARAQWAKLMKEALDADTWGQSVEAMELYDRLYRLMESHMPHLQLSSDEKTVCSKFAHAITLRRRTLQAAEAELDPSAARSSSHPLTQKLTLDDMKSLSSVLDELFVRAANPNAFPIQLQDFVPLGESTTKKDAGGADVFVAHENDDVEQQPSAGGTLQPPPVKAGLTTVSIHVEKIGLKDAQTYINALLTVSVADPNGVVLESQDTPVSNNLRPNYVLFGCNVHIQTPMEEIMQKNLCLFFEFKHYKPAKKKISTRCFALMEARELKVAQERKQVCLELYKKPTDFSRRHLNLFTIKQLYLHLGVTCTQH